MDVFKRNGFDFVERETRQQQQQQQPCSQPQKLWSKPPRSKAGAAATAAAAGQGASPIAGGSAADGHPSSGAAASADYHGHDEPAASLDAGQGDVDDDFGIVGSELLLSAVPVLKRGASGGAQQGLQAAAVWLEPPYIPQQHMIIQQAKELTFMLSRPASHHAKGSVCRCVSRCAQVVLLVRRWCWSCWT